MKNKINKQASKRRQQWWWTYPLLYKFFT